MRYVRIPEPLVVVDAVSGQPNGESVDFATFVRMLVSIAAHKSAADPLTLIDIRDEARRHAPGNVWAIPEDWHALLVEVCRKPEGMHPSIVLSAGDHWRAIRNAADREP